MNCAFPSMMPLPGYGEMKVMGSATVLTVKSRIGVFPDSPEKSSHTMSTGTTIAVVSKLSYPSAAAVSIA